MNRNQWAGAECLTMGWPASIVPGIVAQCMREGSSARCNPQDTTMPWAGSTPYNSVGVQNYLTVDDGLAATKATWENGFYPTVLAAGAAGDPNQWVAAVANGPWGTWSSVAEAQADLAQVMHDPSIGLVQVAGTSEAPPEGEEMTSQLITTGGVVSVHVYGPNPSQGGKAWHWWQATEGADTSWHNEELPGQ